MDDTVETKRLVPGRGSESRGCIPGNCKSVWSLGSILLTVALERLAFYSLVGNLVLFLNSNPFAWESYNALNATYFFLGISYLTSFLGGTLADILLGRFQTLLLSFLIYIIGYVFLPILTHDEDEYDNGTFRYPHICGNKTHDISGERALLSKENGEDPFKESCAPLIYGIMSIVAIGSGAFRANIAPFGADQVILGSGMYIYRTSDILFDCMDDPTFLLYANIYLSMFSTHLILDHAPLLDKPLVQCTIVHNT